MYLRVYYTQLKSQLVACCDAMQVNKSSVKAHRFHQITEQMKHQTIY